MEPGSPALQADSLSTELPGKLKELTYFHLPNIDNDTQIPLLNNQQITEEIKKEIKICLETNDNENTTIQNLWDAVKAVLRGNFIAI